MLDLERDNQILEILKEKNACTIYELSQKLFVSESTIRRDLSRMEQKGLITRTFGGAILKGNPTTEDTSFFLREKENLPNKRALSKAALPFIESDAVLFIDSSTTCLQIVSSLNDYKNLLIITNGLAIANELVSKTRHRVILLGGSIQPSTNSVLGPLAERMLSGFHANLAIMSTSGADPEFGFSELTETQASLKRLMIHNSDRSIVLLDQRKIGRKSVAKTCRIDEISIVISTSSIPEAFRKVAPQTEFIAATL